MNRCIMIIGMAATLALSACAPRSAIPATLPFAPPVAGTATSAPRSSPPVPTVARPTWTVIASPTSTPDTPGRSNVAANAAALATLDLARRLGIAPDGIVVEGVDPDEFPADNLGCLLPGQTPRPIPAIVSGQRIMLRASGNLYEYRAKGTEIVYCGSR
jgi:hypothetical protein